MALDCRTSDHFILAFATAQGPKPHVDEFRPLIAKAAKRTKFGCVVADAGDDSKANHRDTREALGSRSGFPAKHRHANDKPATGKYRRLMHVRCDRKTYRHRVQVETVVSMIKRRLGNLVRARSRWGQVCELALLVLTQSLMLFWCEISFYTARMSPVLPLFFSSRKRRDGKGQEIPAGQAFCAWRMKKPRGFTGLLSGGHGTRTRNRLPGTSFPMKPLAIRLPSNTAVPENRFPEVPVQSEFPTYGRKVIDRNRY